VNLSDYQSPRTDAIMSKRGTVDSWSDLVEELSDASRDLERKLAMCRDIIDACVNGYEKAGMPNATKAIRSLYEQTK